MFNYKNNAGDKEYLKLGLVILSFLLYSYLFLLLISLTDQRASVVSLLPVILISLFYGVRKGILSSICIIVVNIVYLYLDHLPAVNIMIQNIPGILGSIVFAASLGYLHDLQKKSNTQLKIIEKEVGDRKKAEEKLFEIQNVFQSDLSRRTNRNGKSLKTEIGDLGISEDILRKIADNAADIIYTIGMDGYFTYVNKMGLKLTSFTLEELLKTRYSELILPEYRENVKNFYQEQFLKHEQNTYVEYPFRIKDGSVKWFGQNATLIIDEDKIKGFSCIARDITDRKKIEEELKKNEEILRSITHSANDGIITVNSDFKIIQWNHAAERMYGYSEEEMLGSSLINIMPPDYRERFSQIITKENSLDGINSTKTLELRGYSKDGNIFPVEISVAKWSRNNTNYFTHILRDISERKRAQQRILQSEKDYRLLFENAREPIILIRPENEIIIEANQRACSVYGYKRAELIGSPLDIISYSGQTETSKKFENLKEQNSVNFETVHFRKDGKELYFEISASVTEYRGEQVILTFNRDITDRVLAERKLQDYKEKLEKLVLERTEKLESTNKRLFHKIEKLTEADLRIQSQVEFFKTLINTIPIPVFLKNKEDKYSDCNTVFEEFFGISKENIIGKNRINLTPLEKGHINNKDGFETHVVDKNGQIHEVIVYQTILIGKDKVIEGTVGIILDITQQKKMQEEIKKALESEKELSSLKTKFVSTISHEFRTPLTSILASTELLQRYNDKWTNEKKLEILKRIENSVLYMNEMVSDVLTLNKAETGRMLFNPAKTDIIGISKIILEEIKLFATPEHRFVTKFSNKISNTILDERLIRHILNNLLTNAVKYSPNGGEIYFSIDRKNDQLEITIKDKGIGIAKEDQEKLFQPFFRGSNIENISGTGLGLSILHRAVSLHGGKIQINSEVNKGTEFIVIIPVKEEYEKNLSN
jgi:PAS domain S-box-containing protein